MTEWMGSLVPEFSGAISKAGAKIVLTEIDEQTAESTTRAIVVRHRCPTLSFSNDILNKN